MANNSMATGNPAQWGKRLATALRLAGIAHGLFVVVSIGGPIAAEWFCPRVT